MTATFEIRLIDTAESLELFCNEIKEQPWIAVDTEFLREKTFYPKLCLVQIAVPGSVACIDPLALDDLTPLLDIIFDNNVIKVMHAARQDMEIFFQSRQQAPSPVFDTQVAALLLGYPDQIGYGNLVREILGVTLEKLHTRADWSERPLSQDMLQYAADDVTYLVEVYQLMLEKLETLGRLDWLSEDFEQFSDPALYSSHPENAWLKVKGINRLKGASLSIVQSLASWREALAQKKDRPRGWMMRDDVMVDIARHKPTTTQALAKIRGVTENLVNRDGEKLLSLITRAAKEKPVPFQGKQPHARLSPSQDALVDTLMAVVRMSGEANQLNPAVLANRKQLEKLVLQDGNCDVMHGWRRNLVGKQLQSLLDGELSLTVKDGELVIQQVNT